MASTSSHSLQPTAYSLSDARTARAARRRLLRSGPPPLVHALRELDLAAATDPAATEIAARAWIAAALGVTIGDLFGQALARRGRAVVELIFALHTRLQHGTKSPLNTGSTQSPAQSPEASPTQSPTANPALTELAPFDDWIDACLRADSPWRGVLMTWIDLASERLTLHRYAEARHRARHAEGLSAAPLRLLAAPTERPAAVPPAADPSIARFADAALAFWDLLHAADVAPRGWNRIDPPTADRLGGFYGLADEARPPDAEAIRAAAGRLLDELRSPPTTRLGPPFDEWYARMAKHMRAALTAFLEDDRWPAWTQSARTPSEGGILARLRRVFRRREKD